MEGGSVSFLDGFVETCHLYGPNYSLVLNNGSYMARLRRLELLPRPILGPQIANSGASQRRFENFSLVAWSQKIQNRFHRVKCLLWHFHENRIPFRHATIP